VIWVNVGIVLLLILIEGLFVAAEIALVSLREGQVKALAESSKRGARLARLHTDPNRFLAAVQLGVTTTALLSSAYGAVTLAESAKSGLEHAGLGTGLAGALGVIGVTLIISDVTLVIGELAPKRIGLQRAGPTALFFGPSLDRFANVSRPIIWLLSKQTDLVVRLLGGDPHAKREAITEDELRDMVAAHEALSTEERNLIAEVFTAGERHVREVMVPRTEVDFLDAAMPLGKAAVIAAASPHSRFPVERGSHDEVIGFVHVRDIFGPSEARSRSTKVGELAREVAMLPDSRTVLAAMSDLRRAGQHIAVVVDEYGGTAGIVTLEDLIEELVGDIRDEYDPHGRSATRLGGGDVEVDGLLNLDEFAEATERTLPEGPYETAAGYVLTALGRLPVVGDVVDAGSFRLAVTEMDGRRIARVRVSALPAGAAPGGAVAQDGAVARDGPVPDGAGGAAPHRAGSARLTS